MDKALPLLKQTHTDTSILNKPRAESRPPHARTVAFSQSTNDIQPVGAMNERDEQDSFCEPNVALEMYTPRLAGASPPPKLSAC